MGAPAVGRALVELLGSLPRPVFPGVLLPLAGECGMQLDYERAIKLIDSLAPTSKAVFNKCVALAKKLAERPGFEVRGLAAGLADGLMQPPQPFLHEATDFLAMLVEGEAAQQAVLAARAEQLQPQEMSIGVATLTNAPA